MAKRHGEFETWRVLSVWSAVTPDGRKAIVFDTARGPMALEVTDDQIRTLMAKLSDLIAHASKSSGQA